MGMFDSIRKKAEKAVDQHGDKIAKGIDQASAAASKKTGGKHDAKLSKGATAAKNALDKLDGRKDDMPRTREQEATSTPPPAPPVSGSRPPEPPR